MEMSETISALADALAKAQSDIQGALKDSTNPHFRSKYADLASVWDAWQRVGPAQGLSVSQWPGACENGVMALTTLLAHKSGEWMRETLTIPLGKVDAQGYGSATTYARRYALAAMAGIAPEDDDGNAASAAKPVKRAEKAQPAQSVEEKQSEPGDKEDTLAQWRVWVDKNKELLRKLETSGERDKLSIWKNKYDANLAVLMRTDTVMYDELMMVFDDVSAALRQSIISAG